MDIRRALVLAWELWCPIGAAPDPHVWDQASKVKRRYASWSTRFLGWTLGPGPLEVSLVLMLLPGHTV